MTLNQRIQRDLKLSKKRFLHTLGVAEAVVLLIDRHFPGLDKEEMIAAALLHDFTKEYTLARQKELCETYSITIPPESQGLQKLYHAKTAAAIAREVYGLPDYIQSAIYYHTTGRPNMTDPEKCLYFADYIEPNRTDPYCVAVREYYEHLYANHPDKTYALNKAIAFSFEQTIDYLNLEGKTLDPMTIKAKEYYDKITTERKDNMTQEKEQAQKALELATAILGILEDKKGIDPTMIEVGKQTVLADYFVIGSGTSVTHVKSLADDVEKLTFEKLQIKPNHIEGYTGNTWILLDYGSVIVHIFNGEGRDFYKLEKLWNQPPRAEKINEEE